MTAARAQQGDRQGRAARVGAVVGLAGFALLLAWSAARPEHGAAIRTAAVAWLMACWWVSEALPLAATALVPVFLFPLLGILPAAETCRQYGHHLILLFLGGFLLARALSRWELDRRLALLVTAAVGGSSRGIVLGVMAVTAFLSMWVSNSATAAMMMPVALAIVNHAAREVEREGAGHDVRPGQFRFGTGLMLGTAYAASIGGVGTLVGTPPNVLLAAMMEDMAGVTVGFAQWMLVGLPVVLVALPLVWLWIVYLAYAPELARLPGGREVVLGQLRELGRMTRPGWLTTAVVGATALAWVTRALWERALIGAGLLAEESVKDASVGILGAVALFVVPAADGSGRRLLDRTVWKEVPWNVLLLFGGGLALAAGFVESGLAERIGSAVVTLRDVPAWVFVLVIIALVILLTEFASNTASTAMILPLLASSAAALGLHAPTLMVPAALAASMAFMMPAATPPNAIVFGTGYVRISQMVRAGIGANLLGLIVIELLSLGLVGRVW
jgi:sodium-dependent dicarboxylate transporter 2/3/5